MRPWTDLQQQDFAEQVSRWLERHISADQLASDLDCQALLDAHPERVRRYGPLQVLRFGPDRPGGLLAWGYPHPDEPLGATALLALAGALEREALPGSLADWPVRLVLCADPEGARRNRAWIAGRPLALADLAEHHDRPLGAGREVDYSFPIHHGPHRAPDQELMAESVALADLLTESRPQLVALMHNSLLGADFTFLSHIPGPRLVAGFDALARRLGRPRWQLPDPTYQPLLADRLDLLAERTLEERLQVSARRHGALQDGQVLLGAASAAMFCQSLPHPPLVITPEAALFTAPTSPDEQLTVGQLASRELHCRGQLRLSCMHHQAGLSAQQRRRLEAGHARDLTFQAALNAELRALPADEQWHRELHDGGRLGLLLELAGPASPRVAQLRAQLLDELGHLQPSELTGACRSMLGRVLLAAGAA